MANKAELTKELKELLIKWESVLTQQNALETEYITLSKRITTVCNALDEIAKTEVVK